MPYVESMQAIINRQTIQALERQVKALVEERDRAVAAAHRAADRLIYDLARDETFKRLSEEAAAWQHKYEVLDRWADRELAKMQEELTQSREHVQALLVTLAQAARKEADRG